jgi:single-stranded-DNA-specific exonuclease
MQKKWLVKSPIDSTTVEDFRSKLKVDRIVAELLLQRGINTYDEAEAFFRPDLEELHDPFLMKDMDRAVKRLVEAINGKQKILLFGDYDVDGTTAVASLYSFLKIETLVDYYIPDRYKEGYGLSYEGIDFALEHDFDLVIALDCGIKSIEEIEYAASHGLDFIVCDHHTPGDVLPDCIVLNPKRKDCEYPYKELSGCGVGFKLLQAFVKDQKLPQDRIWTLLDFVALSIGADIVEVTGENRILCHHGLKLLNEVPRPAFKELLILAKRSFPVTLTDVVFTIAPRINAAGRLRSGKYAVQLMISHDTDEITSVAQAINEDNENRRKLDSEITEAALTQIENDPDYDSKVTTVVYDEYWHKGVVGIVASRLIEKSYRPTIVLTLSNGVITGSGRSINGVDLYSALEKCSDLLEQFGGHTHAAGMTLMPENLDTFKQRFNEAIAESITPADLIEEQDVDMEIDFNEIFRPEENRLKIPRLKRILRQFEPHGPGNMKPVFVSKNVYSTSSRVLKDAHLKLSMTQPPHDLVIDGIGFNMPEKEEETASGLPFDIAYTMEINSWNNRETLQLNLKDIRPTI